MSFHCTSMAVGLLNSLLSSFAREVRAAFSVESGFRRDSLSCFSAPANTRVALLSFPLDLASRSVETSSTGWTNVGGSGVHVWVCEDVGVWEECVVCIWQVKFHSQTPVCMKSQGMRLQCTLHITYAWQMCVCARVCMCACVCMCMCACVHVCMCACVHVCACACVQVVMVNVCVLGQHTLLTGHLKI